MHNCNYCDHTTTVKSNLRRHIKNKHENHATPKISFIKKYNCSRCNYASDRKWTVKDHERRVHNNVNVTNQSNEFPTTFSVQQNQMQTNRAPVTMSIGDNVGRAPTTMYVGQNVERAPTTMYTEPIQIGTGPPKHVSMELYQKAVNAISNWVKVHKNDVEEKNKLSEELHYEKVAKEALPIHIDNNILKKISILRGVKKNHNMGHYPEEMINCICEALWNLNKRGDKMMCGYTICKLRARMSGIHRYLKKLSRKNVSMKKKRRILSKPQVGKGIFTAIASFVLPALISLITKK